MTLTTRLSAQSSFSDKRDPANSNLCANGPWLKRILFKQNVKTFLFLTPNSPGFHQQLLASCCLHEGDWCVDWRLYLLCVRCPSRVRLGQLCFAFGRSGARNQAFTLYERLHPKRLTTYPVCWTNYCAMCTASFLPNLGVKMSQSKTAFQPCVKLLGWICVSRR